MPKMTFIERDGTRREVEAPLGLSVLEVAHRHGVRADLGRSGQHRTVDRDRAGRPG